MRVYSSVDVDVDIDGDIDILYGVDGDDIDIILLHLLFNTMSMHILLNTLMIINNLCELSPTSGNEVTPIDINTRAAARSCSVSQISPLHRRGKHNGPILQMPPAGLPGFGLLLSFTYIH
jgi:hypothetical protein